MLTPQNVLKMSTARPDTTSRETATPLTDGCNDNQMVELSPFDQQFRFQVSGVTQASLETQLD